MAKGGVDVLEVYHIVDVAPIDTLFCLLAPGDSLLGLAAANGSRPFTRIDLNLVTTQSVANAWRGTILEKGITNGTDNIKWTGKLKLGSAFRQIMAVFSNVTLGDLVHLAVTFEREE